MILLLLSLIWTDRLGTGSDAFAVIPKQSYGKDSSSTLVFSTSTGENDGSDTEETWNKGGRVYVEVCRSISFPPGSIQGDKDPLCAASKIVREAWMQYHWKKGGGLPIVILEKQSPNDCDDDSNAGKFNGKKRVIAPVLMEETISSFPQQAEFQSDASPASLELEYKVTSPGPFFGPDLVEGSHTGRVTFSSSFADSNDKIDTTAITTTLIWSVEFDAVRLLSLYQKVTEFTIGTAATTVQEAASTPRLFTISTRLPMAKFQHSNQKENNVDSPSQIARREWLDFLYSTSGGGLPIPPPIPFGEILPEGGGIARKRRLIFPYVVETAMVEGPGVFDTNGSTTVCYKLENPGWWTFPFLFHTHLGRVRFQEAETTDGLVGMTWEVEIRPYAFTAPLIEKLTEIVVTTIARNLRTKLEFPGAIVTIVPGKSGSLTVPRATWIGRVLEARANDKRSSWEQSVSLLQPWTWGDSGTGRRGEDEVEFEWSSGGLE